MAGRGFELPRRSVGADEGFSGKVSIGAPGEIASGPAAPRPPLRSGPLPRLAQQRPTRRRRRVVELGFFSAGSSNYNADPSVPTKGSRAR